MGETGIARAEHNQVSLQYSSDLMDSEWGLFVPFISRRAAVVTVPPHQIDQTSSPPLTPIPWTPARAGVTVGRPGWRHQSPTAYSLAVSSGTAWNRSATRPTSATWKIGASGSLLIATITLLSFMPARCWIAPEIPQAM